MTETDLRNKIVYTALSYVGVKEGSSTHKSFVDLYNKNKSKSFKMGYKDAWCATFISAIAIKCNMKKIIPIEAYCPHMVKWFKDHRCWQENDAYIPSIGDIIFYYWDDIKTGYAKNDCKGGGPNGSNAANHVGIVYSVTNNKIYVIEGNSNIKGNQDKVAIRNININGRFIRGFGTPNYKSLVTKSSTPTIIKIDTYQAKCKYKEPLKEIKINSTDDNGVRWLQWHLITIMRTASQIKINGKFDFTIKNHLINFQKKAVIPANGKLDKKTRDKLKSCVKKNIKYK